MKLPLLLLATTVAVACSRPDPVDPVAPGDEVVCETATYPSGAVEPMALGEVISPYRWADASLRRTGGRVTVDLAEAPCALDDDIDWSPFDVLLFVSIPAW